MKAELKYLAPSANDSNIIGEMNGLPLRAPFSEDVMALIESLSDTLLKNKDYSSFPELVALGF